MYVTCNWLDDPNVSKMFVALCVISFACLVSLIINFAYCCNECYKVN